MRKIPYDEYEENDRAERKKELAPKQCRWIYGKIVYIVSNQVNE